MIVHYFITSKCKQDQRHLRLAIYIHPRVWIITGTCVALTPHIMHRRVPWSHLTTCPGQGSNRSDRSSGPTTRIWITFGTFMGGCALVILFWQLESRAWLGLLGPSSKYLSYLCTLIKNRPFLRLGSLPSRTLRAIRAGLTRHLGSVYFLRI